MGFEGSGKALLFGLGLTLHALTPLLAWGDEEYVDFTNDVTYVQIVTPGGSNACPGGAPAVPQAHYTACLSEPYRSLCSGNSARLQARRQQLRTRLLELNQRVNAVYPAQIPAAEENVGRLSAHSRNERFVDRYLDYLDERTQAEVSRPTRPAVEATLARVLTTFVSAVGRSGIIPSEAMPDVRNILQACIRNPTLDISTAGLLARNATCFSRADPTGFADRIGHHHSGDRVRVLGESFTDCHLTLSGETWLDCAEGRPGCFMTVFHELGHALNSCRFYGMAKLAELAQRGRYGPEAHPDFAGSYQDFLSVARRTGRVLGQRIHGMASCLNDVSGTSAPHNAIPNACGVEGIPPDDPVRTRCGLGSVSGFPSQWSEAEADFWSASALGEHFSNPPYAGDSHRVREDFGEILGVWCERLPLGTPSLADLIEDSARFKTRLAAYKGVPPSSAAKPPACAARPASSAAPLPSPWNDPHQTWETRFNRNFLRNEPLRHALGCDERAIPDILTTCRPDGSSRTRVPIF